MQIHSTKDSKAPNNGSRPIVNKSFTFPIANQTSPIQKPSSALSPAFLNELIHIAGHDLRSPIFVIRSYAQLLQRTKEKERLDRGFKLIDEATVKLENTINSLVQLVDTYTLLKPSEELLLFENAFQQVKFNLSNEIEKSHPIIKIDFKSFPVIRFYSAYLNDILHLFIENSIKHNPESVGLKINIKSYQRDNKMVLEVKDNGIGIMDSSELKKISSPFYSNSNAANCVGIGLSKVQAIASICGGELEFENVKEGGFIARYIF